MVPKVAAAAGSTPGADLSTLLSQPRLQRWVGVQYHPETELESHYGEMTMARCFDMVVYVDETRALRPIEVYKCHRTEKNTGFLASCEEAQAKCAKPPHCFLERRVRLAPRRVDSRGAHATLDLPQAPVPPTNKRLFKEYNRLMRHPIPNIEAHPLEDNVLEWHFLIRCDQEPYAGGQYHGRSPLLANVALPFKPCNNASDC